MNCPHCQSNRVTPCDKTKAGSQRYQCMDCKRKFTPKANKAGRKRKYQSNAEKQKAYRKKKLDKDT